MVSGSSRFGSIAACAVCASGILLFGATARAADAPADTGSGGAPSSLDAGGLKPPSAISADTAPPPSQTEQRLDQADKADSGRGLEFVWLNVEGGGETLGLQTLRAKQLVDGTTVHSKQTGLSYGAGLGVRLLVFTLGARFRVGSFSDFRLWTLNLEGGMHVPLGRVEPYFTVGGGYASLGALGGQFGPNLKNAAVGAKGFDLRASAGIDVYLTDTFSVGANLAGDVLFLARSAADPNKLAIPLNQQSPVTSVYSSDGSGIGMGGTLTAVVGLHF